MTHPRSWSLTLGRYAAVIPLVAALTWVKLLFASAIGFGSPFLLYHGAIVGAGWLFGRGPALLTVALTTAAGHFFFVHPPYSFHFESPAEVGRVVTYFVEAVLVAVVVGEIRAARSRAETHAREAERAIESRDAFFSMASHELKNPMTTLTLLLHHIRAAQRDPALLSGHIDDHFKSMARQVDRLSALVANLLEISRISAHRLKLTREPMDLSTVVQNVVARFSDDALAAGCDLRVRVESGLFGSWDRQRIEQIVGNLLSNAIKYGSGKPVEIEVSRALTRVRIRVTDQGIGIDALAKERIFEPFERAVTSRRYNGLGLGLWVARNLLRAMDGEIYVESTSEKGSTFTAELPLGRAP